MKNTIKLFAVFLFTSITFTSCDDVEDLIDVDFDSSISGKYNLNFEAEESNKAISESMTLNLADNNDISKYLNKLKEIKITKITYEITKFTGDQYVNMNVGFYMNGSVIKAPMDYNLDSESAVIYEITDADILNSISTTLLSSKQVTLELKGEYESLASATAELTVVVYFDATANPL